MAGRSEPHILDSLYAALSGGRLDEALACLTPDAVVWHCFDGVLEDWATTRAGWEKLIANFLERGVSDVWRTEIPDGVVQRHLFSARTAAGKRMSWAVCLFVRIEYGLIARIDEYIDRAGVFELAEGELATPGL
jgi:ketosteroid isomerase-like protein